MIRFIVGFICIFIQFLRDRFNLSKSILIKFQNDLIFQHNGFINADKKYLDTFFRKNWG